MYEYWIGENVDYDKLWHAFDDGQAYIQKFRTIEVHLIRITLRNPTRDLPLFNHEVVYKTIKGYFYDLKKLCLPRTEIETAGPLFLYSIERKSGIWDFLGELRQLLLLGTTLADEKVIGEKLNNLDKRIEFLKKHFGSVVSPADFQAFKKARSPRQLERAVQRLIEQGLERVEISRQPFNGDLNTSKAALIDLKKLLDDADSDDQ
ncbi:MAG: hypothetical protein WAK96_07875 [Desulfobaccales bacterium]